MHSSDNIFTRTGTITISGFDFEFGGAAMSVDNTQLYMTGLRTGNNLGRLTLPASVGGSASTAVAPVSISGSVGPTQGSVVTGSLVHNGILYIARSVDYDANGDQNGWIKRANLSVGAQGSVCTMNADNGAYSRRLSQSMGHIPSEWQSLLGGPCFTLGCRMSIVTQAQCGYGFAVFDPADVSSGGGSVPVTALLDYFPGPTNNPATSLEPIQGYHTAYSSYPKNSNGGTDLYSVANAFLGTAFIPKGSRSLLFVTCHGYGLADNGCRPGSSVHCDPNRIQVVAYDLLDLIDVKNGVLQPYEPRPYAWWTLPGWDTPWGSCVGNASPGASPGNFCYLPDRDWLIGLADGTGGFPTLDKIQVWSVASL